MSSTKPKSRAFIIGDEENGLTVIITDPVMVAHYSTKELKEGRQNLMAGTPTRLQMAAIVREIIPTLRGVQHDQLKSKRDRIQHDPHGDYSLAEEQAVQTELDFAQTIAQLVNSKGATLIGTEFCIALDIDPCVIKSRVRSVSPSQQIALYLDNYGYCTTPDVEKKVSTHPQVFPVSGLDVSNLDVPKPWVDKES